MITATTAACVGLAIKLFTGQERIKVYVGSLLIIVFLFVLGRYLLQDAAGSLPLPLPLPRARLRRLLAEAREKLDADRPAGDSYRGRATPGPVHTGEHGRGPVSGTSRHAAVAGRDQQRAALVCPRG
jgi:hypothetical protein